VDRKLMDGRTRSIVARGELARTRATTKRNGVRAPYASALPLKIMEDHA
jgi:hypothetical protein